MLSNITVLGSQGSAADPMNEGEGLDKPEPLPTRDLNLSHYLSGTNEQQPQVHLGSNPLEVLNSIRTREITSKAISGLILSLLKWFRLSRKADTPLLTSWLTRSDILKFEYLAQLLLDSNYIPLALKYFALQDVDKAVDQKHDRDDLG